MSAALKVILVALGLVVPAGFVFHQGALSPNNGFIKEEIQQTGRTVATTARRAPLSAQASQS